MIIVGVDPGLRMCGVAITERKGQRYVQTISTTIAPALNKLVAVRIATIAVNFATAMHEYVLDAHLVGPVHKNGNQALRLGADPDNVLVAIEDQVLVQRGKQERGETQHMSLPVRDVQFAIAGAAWALGLPVVFIQPQTAKKAACGSARATKTQVQRAVTAILGLKGERTEHEYDAMAVAIAGQYRHLPGRR